MAKITGTDSDLFGSLPESPDRGQRETEAAELAAALEALNPRDPAVRELVARFQEQARFIGSPDAEVDSQSEVQDVSEGDNDSGRDAESTGNIESIAGQELSPELLQTLSTLEVNFKAKEDKLSTGIKWTEVEAKLKKSPEKLTVLARLIARGGEPTLTAKLSNGNYRFDELSAESPTGNRDVNFDKAEAVATQLGAELMEPSVYDSFRGKIALDSATWSWLRTTKEVRKTGDAFYGRKGYSRKDFADTHGENAGLRCSLEV